MTTLYILPTQDDQTAFADGRTPGNMLTATFDTPVEVAAYVQGVEICYGLAEVEVVEQLGAKLVLEVDGEETTVEFATQDEVAAFEKGLDDGDGFESPAIFKEGDDDYEKVAALHDVIYPPAPAP
jgi:hypothetical protein